MSKNFPKVQDIRWNFIMNAVLKMSAFIFPMITFPYVSRILGAQGNGKITFATSVISYFSMFAQLGIPTYGIRACAMCRNDKIKLNRTVQELLIINCVTVVLSYILLIVCLAFVPKFQENRNLIIITSVTIILNAIGMDWLFQALEQYSYITIRNLLFKVISIVLMFAFVHKTQDYIVYGAINVIGTCGSNVFNLIYSSKFLEHKLIGNYNFKQHFKPILNFFMMSVSVSVYTNMDSVMLGFMTSDVEVGYYAAATKMKTIVVSAVTALGAVLLPRISNIISEGSKEQFYGILRKSVNFVIIASGSICAFFIIMSRDVIGFLAGEGYFSAIVPMQIISLTIILIALSNITGMQILVPTGRETLTTLSTVYGAIANLIVNALAIPRFGSSGAAIGTVIAEFVVLFVQCIYVRRELKFLLHGIQYKKIFMATVMACIVLVCVMNYRSLDGYFLRLVVGFCVYYTIYGVVLIGLKEEFVIENIFKMPIIGKIVSKLKK